MFSLFHAQSIANYSIVFESYWETPTGDPVNGISTIPLPSNAHWSPLAIATHQTANSILQMGTAASAGIESIAETGSTTAFRNEVTLMLMQINMLFVVAWVLQRVPLQEISKLAQTILLLVLLQ
ncbi:hypothetical protein L3X37_01455 [Sabulilitoribacter arenilitoris]|uniref:Spondin domain-containing protein n=1 Tax=Wocania arenilitoris TaxID=2044858 RepID=A0AAE3ENE0_9FLAO|nr:hypothetical protein [Wocania arenilitoris]MCF7567030.1 hypothetical protein [Wocania arenilitoris]